MTTYPGANTSPSEALFPVPDEDDYEPWEVLIANTDVEDDTAVPANG